MAKPRLAYLLKKFPRLSETFVLGEILGQERLGADVHVFARRPPDDEPRHPELAALRASSEVLPPTKEMDPWQMLVEEGGDDLIQRIRALLRLVRPLSYARIASLLVEAIHLRRRCDELGIRHVHAHFATDSAVTAMLLEGLGGPTFSVTAHAKDLYRTSVNPELLRALLQRCAFMVTVCDANVRHVHELVGPQAARRLRRLYNGIDIESFAARGGAPRERGHVLSVGRLVAKKGFDVLVDALDVLARRGTDFQATIVGQGEDREALCARVRERALSDRVRLCGAIDQDGVRALLARAEVFALPCRIGEDGNRDALPTVLLEAQAAGVPIVSTPVTGIPEILDGGAAGLLVPEGDAAATAEAIARLLGDGALRGRLCAAGRARCAELFDRQVNARVLKSWFDEALERVEERCASST